MDAPLADRVAPGVERVSLRSPTLPPATHTNCYLVGDGDFVVVEPASPWTAEQRLLDLAIARRSAMGHRMLGAMITHHHVDHVSGADALRRSHGASVAAHPATAKKLHGTLSIDREVSAGEALHDALGALGLDLLFTPGHAPGHLCLASKTHGWIIAGDMVAGVGTILIDVGDDGDMDQYLASLDAMAGWGPRLLLPAHGEPIDDAVGRLRFYIGHRLAREAKVLSAVESTGGEFGAVVARAYDDAPPGLLPIAARSARAHLMRLMTRGEVEAEGDPMGPKTRWRRAARTG